MILTKQSNKETFRNEIVIYQKNNKSKQSVGEIGQLYYIFKGNFTLKNLLWNTYHKYVKLPLQFPFYLSGFLDFTTYLKNLNSSV